MASSRALGIAALAGSVLLGGCRFLQDALLYHPVAAPREQPLPPRGWTLEPLALTRPDAVVLRGWLVKPPAERAPAVVYFGGNGEEISWLVPMSDRHGGRAVALVNYRGYGDSTGRPSERALLADALAIVDSLRSRADIDASRVAVMGRSLGSGIAVHVAAQRGIDRVVLVSPYDSIAAVAETRFPAALVRAVLSDRYDCVSLAPAIRAPLLAIAGMRDDIIPVARSRRLFALWGGTKQGLDIARAGHNDLQDHAEYWDAIDAFLAQR